MANVRGVNESGSAVDSDAIEEWGLLVGEREGRSWMIGQWDLELE